MRIIIAVISILLCLTSTAETLITERSLYNQITVKRSQGLICLLFNVRREQRNQSCINPRRPKEMVFTYTRMSMMGVVLASNPKNILVVGLGGGTLPMAFYELFPDAHIDAVEIDPAVTRLAKQYFGFEENDRLQVHERDARVFTKRALRANRRYQIIILDAFNGEYIPEHLMTREYLEETRGLLASDGILIANTFSISDLYDHESATYTSVFGSFINFQVPESANRMILAGALPDDETLLARTEQWQQRLKPYGVPINRFTKLLIKQRTQPPDWDTNARVLTDQYAPANLLQGQ